MRFAGEQHRELGRRLVHESDLELPEVRGPSRVVVLHPLVEDAPGGAGNEPVVPRSREPLVVSLETLLVELLLAVDLHDRAAAMQEELLDAGAVVGEADRVVVQRHDLRAAKLRDSRHDRVFPVWSM